MHAIRQGKGMTIQACAASIPLGKRVDLQDIEPLPCPVCQICVPFFVADIGESTPTGIGQPKEMLPILQQMRVIL